MHTFIHHARGDTDYGPSNLPVYPGQAGSGPERRHSQPPPSKIHRIYLQMAPLHITGP